MRTDEEVQRAAENTARITLALVAAKREWDRARSVAVALEQENELLRNMLTAVSVTASLSEALSRYLDARGLRLPDGSTQYVLNEAEELVEADADGDWFGVELELADVVLACAVLARHLGTTVEACIATKTQHDRGRGA